MAGSGLHPLWRFIVHFWDFPEAETAFASQNFLFLYIFLCSSQTKWINKHLVANIRSFLLRIRTALVLRWIRRIIGPQHCVVLLTVIRESMCPILCQYTIVVRFGATLSFCLFSANRSFFGYLYFCLLLLIRVHFEFCSHGWVFLLSRLQICSIPFIYNQRSFPGFHTNLSSLLENVSGFNSANQQQHSPIDNMDNPR